MRNCGLPFVLAVSILSTALLPQAAAQFRHGKKESKTQVLDLLPSPPAAVTAEASRLEFDVAPITSHGLLSQQVRQALKALFKIHRRGRIVHLRAFVAGSGDTRRVRDVVAEVFTARKQHLPALSLVQVGPLPVIGAQVVLESVTELKKVVNPNGLAFLSGQAVASGEPVLDVAPLVKNSLAKIRYAASGLGLAPSDVLRVTCYCSSLHDGPTVRREMAENFPDAALNHLQLRRVYTRASVTCEAVARLKQPPADELDFFNPEPLPHTKDSSQVAVVGPNRIVFSGTQLGFEHQERDVRLALERMGKSIDGSGSSYRRVAMTRFYTLSNTISKSIRELRWDYLNRSKPPANTLIELEGLPSLDASFAMDVIAVAEH